MKDIQEKLAELGDENEGLKKKKKKMMVMHEE
jgi:hypothetical protein